MGPNIPQPDHARKDMTDAAVATFRQALAQRPDDSDLREKTARANRFAANFHRMLNHNAIAERSYGESIRILEALVADKPNEAVFRDRLAEALRDQAQVIAKLGRLGDAVATGRRAAELAEELRAADPDNPDYRRTLATGLIDLSGYEYIRGKFAASEESAGRAADLFAALVDTPPGEPRPLDALLLAMALHRRAIALGELKQSDRSLKASTDALARLRKLPATSNDVQHFRARILVEQAKVSIGKPPRHAAAETDLGRAIRRWDDLQERYPQIVMYREWQSAAYEIRARLLLALGRPDPAADDLEKSRALLEKLVSEFPDVPSYRSLLGRTYLTFGRVEAARRNTPAAVGWLAKALAACRAALALSPESGLEQRTLGEVQAELKQAAPAGR
jgi:tetratricopeptide (TPR) repeat protein